MNNPAQPLHTPSALAYREEAVVFGDGRWVGVLCLPDSAPRPVAARQASQGGQENSGAAQRFLEREPKSVVIVVVGGPQYRVGSHRQFVQLSRALASQGHASLRFDCTGMGDSPGELRNFLNIGEDIAAAIAFARTRLPTVQTLALWGLCDGASAALLYVHAHGGADIQGLCLLNPWVRSEVSQAQTQVKHYYVERLKNPAFWRKLLKGKVATSAVLELSRAVRTLWLAKPADQRNSPNASTDQDVPFQSRMASAWQKYSGAILLILSGDDYTAKEFLGVTQNDARWKGKLQRRNVNRHDVARADHTFSGVATRLEMEEITAHWLNELIGDQAPVVKNAATTRKRQ